ncbi:helix-turn-helix domain-containing protein [Streptomyces hydrogenans]
MSDVTPLRAARHAARLTAAETARRVGVTTTMITSMESGRVCPSVGVLYGFAVATGMRSLVKSLAPIVAALPNGGRTNQGPRRTKRGA